jgi:hypothetical protein
MPTRTNALMISRRSRSPVTTFGAICSLTKNCSIARGCRALLEQDEGLTES